jgi:hypothetical protein
MSRRDRSLLAHALLALSMASVPMLARPQVPFPIPAPAVIAVGPLMLLLIPLAMEMSQPDRAALRDLELRHDWDGLAALASTRLAKRPNDLKWLALRGQTRQRQGRCEEGLPDLRRVFDGLAAQRDTKVETVFASGLALGLCEMALRDGPAAEQTMARLATLAPARGEPRYNLGVIRALQGEMDAARNELALLGPLNPAMAASLQTYLDACAGSSAAAAARPPAATASSLLPSPQRDGPAGAAADMRLTIGIRTIVLPPGRWVRTADALETAEGRASRRFDAAATQVPVTTLGAYAQAAGATLPVASYELHYARYDANWVVGANWLVPLPRIAGDLVAIQWTQALAARLPLMAAFKPAPRVFATPQLGPLP